MFNTNHTLLVKLWATMTKTMTVNSYKTLWRIAYKLDEENMHISL